MKKLLYNVVCNNHRLTKAVISFRNDIKIGLNRFEVSSVHFNKNIVQIFGENNCFLCEKTGYSRFNSFFIKGYSNDVLIKEDTIISGTGKHGVHVEGKNNTVIIAEGCSVNNSFIFIHGDQNTVSIGKKCRFMETIIHVEGNNNSIRIGDECSFHGRTPYPNTFFLDEGSNIVIGNDVMLAHGIRIRSTDSHSVVNLDGKRLNPAEDVEIGDHVWISMGAMILKGTRIPSHSVVGAGAVCTKKYQEENCVYAGNPVKIVKRQIDWDRKFVE